MIRYWKRLAGAGRERGGGGASLSWVLLTPVLFLLLFGGVAVGYRMYGGGLAQDAANVGARAASVLPVSADRGRQAVQRFLDTSAAGTLTDTTVTITVAGNAVTVTVTGHTALLPGATSRQSTLTLEQTSG